MNHPLTRWLRNCVAATAGAFALTSAFAQQPTKPVTPAPISEPSISTDELKARQEENKKNFAQFKETLFRLATRLEKSDRPEMKEQAKVIRRALDEAEKQGVDGQFAKLVTGIASGKNALDFAKLSDEDKQLVKMLQSIMTILETNDESAARREEMKQLEIYIKELKALTEREKNLQARTESKAGDKDKIAREQDRLKDETQNVADRMNGSKTGPKKDDRAEAKSDPKSGEKGAEPKAETGEAKGDGKEGKESEGKEGKDGAGEGKPAPKDEKAKDGAGEGKGMGKEGEGQDGAGKGKGDGEAKGDGKEGEPKPGDGAAKPGDKPGEGSAKPGDKPGEGGKKPGEGSGKPMDGGKPGEGQGEGKGAGKPGEGAGKPSQGSGKGQGEGKGGGKPSEGPGGEGKGSGQGKPMDPKGGAGSGSKPGGQPGQPGGGNPPPPGGQENKNQTPGRKEVQEAIPFQDQATKKIEENKRPEAGKNQDEAIAKMQAAIQELEKRLKQLREEEMKKLLANVEARCNKMLAMQIDVYEGTKLIDAAIAKNMGMATNAERQKSQKESDKEGEIVAEAERCLKLLESEGSAVAFAKVLEEVKQDMVAVQRRLGSSVVDKDTQMIEENIISLLKDMVEALKKAQQDLQKPPPPPPPGSPPKPPNQKLIDLIAELKLIRSLQVQVNTRTKMFGDKEKSEQVKSELLQAELKQLATRQAKLQEMIEKIAGGENEK